MSLFYCFASLERNLMILRELELSRPEVGSSKTMTMGLEISSIPMATLFL